MITKERKMSHRGREEGRIAGPSVTIQSEVKIQVTKMTINVCVFVNMKDGKRSVPQVIQRGSRRAEEIVPGTSPVKPKVLL